MANNTSKTDNPPKNHTVKVKIALVFFDIFAVNASYLMALYLRFFINGSFVDAANWVIPHFQKVAPVYTLCSLIVFIVFNLYNQVWRFVGKNDLKNILYANLITVLIQILLVKFLVEFMPRSYYVMGFFFQLFMMTAIRIAPRYLTGNYEGTYELIKGNDTRFNVMIVGIDENARILQERIGTSKKNINRAVCFLDYKKETSEGRIINGTPIVTGIEKFRAAIEKFAVNCIIITDPRIPQGIYDEIKSVCKNENIEMRKFFMGTEHVYTRITLSELMGLTSGPVCIIDKDGEHHFDSGEDAVMNYDGGRCIEKVNATTTGLIVYMDVEDDSAENNESEWISKYKEDNNSEVSFF